MIKPPEISKQKLEKDPGLLWRTFVKFIGGADTTEMNDVQMAAQLPFWYDSEITQGGHLLFFESMYHKLGDKLNILILASLDALKMVGADSQAECLGRAADAYFAKERKHTQDPDELAQLAMEGEFEEFDLEYNRCQPEMKELLESYVKAHLDCFMTLV